jgi:hypothetical protein
MSTHPFVYFLATNSEPLILALMGMASLLISDAMDDPVRIGTRSKKGLGASDRTGTVDVVAMAQYPRVVGAEPITEPSLRQVIQFPLQFQATMRRTDLKAKNL